MYLLAPQWEQAFAAFELKMTNACGGGWACLELTES